MKRTGLIVASGAVTSMLAVQAGATGLLVARFGGEHGHPTTDNPTAIYYNPAGLALGKGTRLFIDASLALRSYTYNRSPDAVSTLLDPGPHNSLDTTKGGTPVGDGVLANSGEATLNNVLASPFIGVASDLGIEGLGVGLGFYVPIGGQSKWDTREEIGGYPGSVDGSQRWWVMEGSIRSLYITAAGAYYIKPARLSIGLGVNAVKSEIFTVRARNADGSDDLVNRTNGPGDQSADRLKEGRGLVNLASWDLSLGFGLVYEPIDKMYIGLSYQTQPGFGENTLTGEATTVLTQGASDTKDAEAVQSMPDVIRAGWRWRQGANEYRLFGDYARWSLFDRQCIQNTSATTPCDLANIPRQWEDAFGVRAGYSRFVHDDKIELYIGGGYDQNAIPDATLEPALYDAEKMSVAVGGKLRVLDDALRIAATWTQVIYFDRETDVWPRDPSTGSLIPQGPYATAPNPNAAGTYSQAIGVFNLNVEYAF